MMNDLIVSDNRPIRPAGASTSSLVPMTFSRPRSDLPCNLHTDRQQMRWWALYARSLAAELRHCDFTSLPLLAETAGYLAHAWSMALEYRDSSLLH